MDRDEVEGREKGADLAPGRCDAARFVTTGHLLVRHGRGFRVLREYLG